MDRKRIIIKFIIAALLAGTVAAFLAESGRAEQEERGGIAARLIGRGALELYLPGVAARQGMDKGSAGEGKWTALLMQPYPVFGGLLSGAQDMDKIYAESDYEQLLLLEGTDEERKNIAQDELAYGDDALHLESRMEEALEKENGLYLENRAAAEDETEESVTETEPEMDKEESKEKPEGGFVPAAGRAYQYPWESLREQDSLIKAFYAVDATTVADPQYIELEKLLSQDMRLSEGGEEPQILIYHTHSLESFIDSVPGDESTTIVGIGDYLAQLLQERYGYRVMHHTACYDEERDYAYSKSLPAMEELLAQNPSIEVVIDLHRDEMPEDRRLVVDLQGRPTAQFMFFNGMSQTRKGRIDYLENPYLSQNLAFSFQMQVASNEYYPGIARRIYLKAYRYNMHLCPKTLLIELGAQNNTVEEIRNACEPLAHILHLVLSGEEPVR